MNFSAIEDSVLEEKKKFSNFLSHFLKNSRILIILLIISVITAVTVSVWIKAPDYKVLYNHLSHEDRKAVINQLNQMNIPYKFTENSGELLVPKSKIYEIRLHLSENNLPRSGGIGFELLDKEKFGVSQFNEQINYQRALEGELARTIQRINSIKSARIHIALPKSSLFLLQDKKKPSASVILDVQIGKTLDANQINSILHLISSSISDLSVENITIVDQFGKLLNHPSLGYDQINDLQFKYSEDVESRYRNRIKSILEPLVGIGNVDAQVTAQINFNAQEKTQEKYLPNTNYKNQSIRSHQSSVHNQINQENIEEDLPDSLSSNISINPSKNIKEKNKIFKDNHNLKSNINRDNTINYELNHTVSHTKMNIGEIKRLSAAVVINFIPNKNGKLTPLTLEEVKNIKLLIHEAIGYSKNRGDSVHVVNALFVKYHEKYNKKFPVQFNNSNKFKSSHILFTFMPWLLIILFLFFLFRRYACPFLKNDVQKNNSVEYKKHNIEKYNIAKAASLVNVEDTLHTDKLIHKICNISNQNPRTIALIIRQWMSDKI